MSCSLAKLQHLHEGHVVVYFALLKFITLMFWFKHGMKKKLVVCVFTFLIAVILSVALPKAKPSGKEESCFRNHLSFSPKVLQSKMINMFKK